MPNRFEENICVTQCAKIFPISRRFGAYHKSFDINHHKITINPLPIAPPCGISRKFPGLSPGKSLDSSGNRSRKMSREYSRERFFEYPGGLGLPYRAPAKKTSRPYPDERSSSYLSNLELFYRAFPYINFSFCSRLNRFILISSKNAFLKYLYSLNHTNSTGIRARVYFAPFPALCSFTLRSRSGV
jgi:hypothetical protein